MPIELIAKSEAPNDGQAPGFAIIHELIKLREVIDATLLFDGLPVKTSAHPLETDGLDLIESFSGIVAPLQLNAQLPWNRRVGGQTRSGGATNANREQKKNRRN